MLGILEVAIYVVKILVNGNIGYIMNIGQIGYWIYHDYWIYCQYLIYNE